MPPPNHESKAELRRYVRAPVRLPATIVGALRGAALTRDVSYQGISLTMDDPPQVNHLVRLRIELPDKTLAVHAVVVRVLQMAGASAVVGLRLFALNGQDKLEWDDFVASLLRTARAA